MPPKTKKIIEDLTQTVLLLHSIEELSVGSKKWATTAKKIQSLMVSASDDWHQIRFLRDSVVLKDHEDKVMGSSQILKEITARGKLQPVWTK